jgi:hypothetical protein
VIAAVEAAVAARHVLGAANIVGLHGAGHGQNQGEHGNEYFHDLSPVGPILDHREATGGNIFVFRI